MFKFFNSVQRIVGRPLPLNSLFMFLERNLLVRSKCSRFTIMSENRLGPILWLKTLIFIIFIAKMIFKRLNLNETYLGRQKARPIYMWCPPAMALPHSQKLSSRHTHPRKKQAQSFLNMKNKFGQKFRY
jgi:hypothetical protein